MATDAQSWDDDQLHAIARWYGASSSDPSLPGEESSILAIDPASPRGRTLRTLQDLFECKMEAREAAKDLAFYIFAAEDPTASWGQMLAAVCFASEDLERSGLFRLANLMVELARLPHDLPRHPYDPNDGSSYAEPRELTFAELPGFGFQLREAIQAPTQYICHLENVTVQARSAARDRWCNASSFLAITTSYAYREMLPQCVDFAWRGLDCIVVALEGRLASDEFTNHAPKAYRDICMEKMPSLWLPAAIMWIILAGRELKQCSEEVSRNAGPLWAEARRRLVPKPSSSEYSDERWSFWRDRLLEFANADVLSLEVTAHCDEAASSIASMLQEDTRF